MFGSVKLTKNADPGKYKYTGYSIGFDSRSEFLFTDRRYGKNVVVFGADTQLTHLRRFAIDSKSKFHVEILLRFHPFRKVNPR